MTFDEKMRKLQALADELFPMGGTDSLTYYCTTPVGEGLRTLYHAQNVDDGAEFDMAAHITGALLEQHLQNCVGCRSHTGDIKYGTEEFKGPHMDFLQAVAMTVMRGMEVKSDTIESRMFRPLH